MELLRTIDQRDIRTDQATYAGSAAESDGTFLVKNLYSDEQIAWAQRDIISLLQVVLGGSPETDQDAAENFHELSHALMAKILSERPKMRKPLLVALRKLPGVQALATNPRIIELLKWMGMTLPLIRLQSLQVFMPWERLFHEQEHQDYGGMISETSWTIQVPLQIVEPGTTGCAEIFPGTFRHGPLMHHLGEPSKGFFHEVVEDQYFQGIKPAHFVMAPGDATFFRCLNIHRTQPEHSLIRWSMILRYDEGIGSALIEHGQTEPSDASYREYEWDTWSRQVQKFFDDYNVPATYVK